MAWLAKNSNNIEIMFHNKPEKLESIQGNKTDIFWIDKIYYNEYRMCSPDANDGSIILPSGSIEKLLGRELSCEDGPVEI